ncbi:MAG: DsbE family thiol:disulfide interchange protein, partial [Burkholderiaceae bacterium]
SFTLPALGTASAPISSQQWRGQWWVLNVWASWCTPCAVEHPVLLQLAQSQRVTLVGLNYKDASPAAQTWLAQRGNPYQTVWVDTQGRVGLDLGVYGVPETYIIDPQGRVRHKHTGAVTPQCVQSTLLPLLETSRGYAGLARRMAQRRGGVGSAWLGLAVAHASRGRLRARRQGATRGR